MRICTCTGGCWGKEGLAPGWRCALEPLPPAQCSAASDEIEILAVIKLPLSMSGFVGLLKGLKRDFGKDVFIRNSPEGYEVFRKRAAKPPNSDYATGVAYPDRK